MKRVRDVRPELPLHQRLTVLLQEDWHSVQVPREPLIYALVTAMIDPDTDLTAVNLLGLALATAGEDGITELIPLLSHETLWIRAYAADGIGSLDNAARWAVPSLVRVLDGSPSDWTAYTIIRALGNIGGVAALTVLESLGHEARRASPSDSNLLQAVEEALASARSGE